ncbi:MAG: hypothetical protein OQJ89_11030 [Kangiellaceae bacterium]|nr:hypothetical protein [Kangiellaceae bacterium]MCW9017490.1 hypothetical protein [Kangiellaceae bacterium]
MNQHVLTQVSIAKLEKVLKLNAMFSVLCAIDMLIFSDLIASFMGFNQPIILQIIAVGLILFGGFVFWLSRNLPNQKQVESVVWMDRSWVLGSIILLVVANSSLSYAGITLVATVAVIVAAFAETQDKYQKRLQAE